MRKERISKVTDRQAYRDNWPDLSEERSCKNCAYKRICRLKVPDHLHCWEERTND